MRRPPSTPAAVHAYPPYAIRSEGIGPYVLDRDMREVLKALPEGPRLELLQLGRYANWRIVRPEGGDLVVGADASKIGFVAVLGGQIARTTSGVGVGATGAELASALGNPAEPGDVVRDRRIDEFETLPGVRFITDAALETPAAKAKVIAVLVARENKATAASARPPSVCRTGGALATAQAEVLAAARGKNSPPIETFVRFGCVSAAAPEGIVVGGGDLVLVAGEPGRLRRAATVAAPGAEFAGALDVDGDGKDDIVWGAQHRGEGEHALEVHVLRWEAGKLVEVLADRPFVVGSETAAAAGVTPAQIDLAVEVRAAGGALLVGGIYLARSGGKLRELAPITPIAIKPEPRKSGAASGAEPAADAAVRDAAPSAGAP